MKSLIYLFLLCVLVFPSCSNESEDIVINETNIDTNSQNTKSIEVAGSYIKPVYRYYYSAGAEHQRDHWYTLTKPEPFQRGTLVLNQGLQYEYEGIAFYTFSSPNETYNGTYPNAILYSRYNYNGNTELFTLKFGEADPNPSLAKIPLGYVFTTQAYGLVAIRSYYSEREKDNFYFASDQIYEESGQVSGNYIYQGIVGYTIPSAANFGDKHPTYFIFSTDNTSSYDQKDVRAYLSVFSNRTDDSGNTNLVSNVGIHPIRMANPWRTELVISADRTVVETSLKCTFDNKWWDYNYNDAAGNTKIGFDMYNSLQVGESFPTLGFNLYKLVDESFSIAWHGTYTVAGVKRIDKNIFIIECSFMDFHM